MEREKRVYVELEYKALRNMLNSFGATRGGRHGRKEVWAWKMLLLLCCPVKGACDGYERALWGMWSL